MTGAVFFDLDRTLLPRASGPVFAHHLAQRGLGAELDIPIAQLFVWLFDQLGETRLNMLVARRLVGSAQGWPVADVEQACAEAAAEIVEEIPAFAHQIIAEHRAAGRQLVLATTSPAIMVRPIAAQLGFDQVIATEWADHDGVLTGDYDGEFIWGPGKRDAITAWAEANGINLGKSWAYSDSYFDSSMLDAVGNPVAVNPDARLLAVATLQGWPVRHFDVPDGVVKVLGREMQDWLRPFNRPELSLLAADFTITGVDNIPTEGPAILAFNHRSYFDTVAMNYLVARTGRPCRFLGKREVFNAPVLGAIARAVGGIPVDRASGSTEPLQHAIKAIEAGELIALAPQGTIPRGPAFFETTLKGRNGAARLAAQTGAPVIPIGLWGTETVWPRNQRIPTLTAVPPPEVTVTVGPAVKLANRSPAADTKKIMAAIVKQLPDEARTKHTPTADELARTYPSGYRGDPSKESERRPGVDT